MVIENLRANCKLNNGVRMPYMGLGVYLSEEGEEVINAVKWALKAGYRSIDTAAIYKNEEGVGKAIQESEVPREEIFLTTKIWNADQGYQSTIDAFNKSLKKLNTDYVDLLLIHWPVKGKYVDTWKALEKIYHDGKARAIGVSNFLQHQLEDILKVADITPMVNQIEFHPELQQPALLEFCKANKIQVEAWAPMMQGKIFEVPEIKALAEKYGKSPAHIVLRWDVQMGVVTIPKSVKEHRIIENANIFDFELSDEDMLIIKGLDKNKRIGPDPDNFDF
ncbi:aldo/keto reductase [Sediminitomix flava]|uniref:Diketogulonate reductase-like aldo/keto reductase n=1 Tax=Sediminitomix flava TaxID=379075 RepID=A0A315ZCU9_SEDFL|nr:aldo/keto reductase [Sediminitomix flava]PWJ42923.1 diketogulonate reductase-like aldo/keto reductase [Sediminitomix flava]